MMKNIVLLALILLAILACSEKPSQIKITDANQDGDFPISPSNGLLGNVDFRIISKTIQGTAIVLINGPGAAIGYDIRDKNDSSFIYFADSYIGAGGYAMQTGTQIPYNKWIHVRMVIYTSGLSGLIVSLLDALGMDFFNSVEDYMIEKIYEADVMLISNDQIIRLSLTEGSKEVFKQNTQNETFKKVITTKRYVFEKLGININQLLQDLKVLKGKMK